VTSKAVAEHLVRHRLHVVSRGQDTEIWCTACGLQGTAHVMMRHIRASRRWRYLGTETHFGEAYHLWEHQLTGRKFAWLARTYQILNSRAVQ
jgi:hypothetical protein